MYIGETGKTLKVRMAEHKRAVESKDPLNGITVHVQKTAHNINWQEARILARENNWGRRRVIEAFDIQQRRPKMNLVYFWIDRGLPLFIQGAEVKTSFGSKFLEQFPRPCDVLTFL